MFIISCASHTHKESPGAATDNSGTRDMTWQLF